MMGLKTLWEKEKMLVTSNMPFSYSDFKNLLPQGHLKSGKELTLSQTTTTIDLVKMPSEKLWEKGGNASNQHFLLFPQGFLPFQ